MPSNTRTILQSTAAFVVGICVLAALVPLYVDPVVVGDVLEVFHVAVMGLSGAAGLGTAARSIGDAAGRRERPAGRVEAV
jgi:hypothetical protein